MNQKNNNQIINNMGLFHRNENEANFAGGSKNILESIQRQNDTGTLIYLDPRQDFNTKSTITVAPNEQVIFIRNGAFYGLLPGGNRYEVETDNYPVLSRIRNMLSGGVSTFSCQVYHVSTSIQEVLWGTASPIELEDHHLGDGIPTMVRGAGKFLVRFNIDEDDEACKKAFMQLMGDKSTFTGSDLSFLFRAKISQKISSLIGKKLEERSMSRSINAISSQLEDFADEIKPFFEELFVTYGLEVVDFSFESLSIDGTDIRRKYIDRLSAAKHTGSYDKAMQQELLENVSLNPGAGGVASAGAGIGMGMAAGNAFANMATTAFANPQPQQQAQPTAGFGGQGRFGVNPATSQPDPMESLLKMKQLLDAGLITQEVYDAKVAEIMQRL